MRCIVIVPIVVVAVVVAVVDIAHSSLIGS